MSIFGSLVSPRIGNTIPGTVVRSISSSAGNIRSRNGLRHRKDIIQQHRVINAVTNLDVEQIFINALVAASSCSLHKTTRSLRHSTGRRSSSTPFRHDQRPLRQCRGFSSSSKQSSLVDPESDERNPVDKEERPVPAITAEEYKRLVNTYAGFGGKVRGRERGSANKAYYPLASRLFMTAEQEEACESNGRILLKPEDDETKEHLESLEKILGRPLGRVSHEKLWHAYESLPGRRSRYLSDENIRRLFRHLSWVEFRSSTNAMQRYMALLDHCNDEGLELSADIWNTAISFTAKWIPRTSTDEVRAAVETWMRMEKAGFEPTNVTFNILFDVAIRAGRYGLADTIYQELVTRKMPLNRYFRTSVIFYAGLQKNGDGVRNAFRDLVNGGEIVDTSIMNCVMLSLIRAGEGAAAENVFARMKELMEQKLGTVGPKSWQAQKKLNRFLDHTARSLREERDTMPKTFFGTAFSNEDRKDAIQKATPLAPNAKSYRILIAHHATTSGDFGRIRELMKEMSNRGLNIHGSVFFVCLKGFLIHGSGSAYSRSVWNRQALEEIWSVLLAAADASSPSASSSSTNDGPADPSRKAIPAEVVDEDDPDLWADNDDDPRIDASVTLSEESRAPYFTVALACITLKAFHRYAGRRRMIQIWEEMQLVTWREMTAEQRLNVQHCVDRLR